MGLVLLCYFAQNSEGFGLPVSTFSKAMEQLNALDPMKNVYLDFDKTIIVNGYSEVVRNGYCQEEYPECAPFNVSDDKVISSKYIVRDEQQQYLIISTINFFL
jgi:hypothetical protein